VAISANTEALRGLQDLRVESRLLQFLEGGKRPGESSLFPSHPATDISSRSSRLLEGKDININITAPGAAIALGLIFIRSNNPEMLQRLSLPSTIVALEAIWSDLLLYRAIAACLVQWEEVIPTEEWIRSKIPEVILSTVFPPGSSQADAAKKDPKLLYQTGRKLNPRTALSHYLCAVTGYCFGMGIVHAGTSNATAKQTILMHLRLLQRYDSMTAIWFVLILTYGCTTGILLVSERTNR
jgi:anaphase-promoting complex subunit 1